MRINYSKYYPWGGAAGFNTKILSGQKLHTIRKTNWGAKKGAALSHGQKVGGKGFKRVEFLLNECTGVQPIEIIFNKEKVIACNVEGKPVDWRLIAKNDGLTEEQFSRWFHAYQEDNIFKGFIIHWTPLKY